MERTVEFWEKPTEDAQWQHRSLSSGRYFLNGLEVEPFDLEKIYDAAYAVSAYPPLGSLTRLRSAFADSC